MQLAVGKGSDQSIPEFDESNLEHREFI